MKAGIFKQEVTAISALIFIILAATLVRSTELGPSSLWTDDAWVALAIKEPWPNIIHTSLTSIGFRALIRVMLETFGNTSLVAQFLPYVFGILTIPMTYIVARQLKITPWFALFSAFMVASSPTLVDYSVRVKQYTGDALITLAVLSILIWLMRHPAKLYNWVFFGILCCLAIVYSGQLLIIICPAVAFLLAYCWIKEKSHLFYAISLAILTGTFSLYWYFGVLRPAIHPGLINYWSRDFIIIDQGLMTFLQTFGIQVGSIFNDGFGNNAVHIAGGLVLTLTAIYLRSRLTFFLLLPVLLAIILAIAGKAPVGTRTDAYFLPLMALAMAIGAEAWFTDSNHSQHRTKRRVAGISVLLLLFLILVWDFPERFWPDEYPHQDIRILTGIWEENERNGDHTFVYSGARHAFSYYSNERLKTLNAEGEPMRGIIINPDITLLGWRLRNEPERYFDIIRDKVTGRPSRVWLIAGHTGKGDIPVLKQAILSAGYLKKQRWDTDGDAELILYIRKKRD